MADQRTPADFPPEVHASLAALQRAAVTAKHKHDEGLRRCTPDELALSELLRQPTQCTAHSSRTGLACRAIRVPGGTVCYRHGAALSHVKLARERRLQCLAQPVIGEMYKMAMAGGQHTRVKQMAAADLLDRAGVGALAEAKVRSSYRGQPLVGVSVQIGFLATLPGREGSTDEQPLLPAGTDVVDGETAEAQGDRGAGDGDPAAAVAARHRAERDDAGSAAAGGDGSGAALQGHDR